MIVVRPNQLDENDYNHVSGGTRSATQNEAVWTAINDVVANTKGENGKYNGDKILVVNGCGTAKDTWGARGYTINGNRAYDISNEFSGNSIMETHMENSYIYTTYNSTKESNSFTNGTNTVLRVPQYNGNNLEDLLDKESDCSLRFNYTTNNDDIICWFQEWQRIIPKDTYKAGGGSSLGAIWGDPAYHKMYWFESYQEKLSHVKLTFDMAISDNYSSYVFINSLDGYYAESGEGLIPSIDLRYGGAYGNWGALANQLNSDFYTYVNQRIKQAKAPTGIVLMNFVSNDEEDGASYYLPQLILSNNEFKVGVGDGNDDDDDDDDDDDVNTGGGDSIGGGGGNDDGGGGNDDGDGGDSDWT